MKKVAALFVESQGIYFGLKDVDPWDIYRNALNYNGNLPVVCHPPCSVWSSLAYINEKRYGHKVGDDKGLFEHALNCVRKFGGVLEHPANSLAWKKFGLKKPFSCGGWSRADKYGFTCHVEQGQYGFPARKQTWLYAVSSSELPELRWGKTPEENLTHLVSFFENKTATIKPRLSKKDAKKTPIEFRDVLIEIARNAQKSNSSSNHCKNSNTSSQ